MKVDFDIALEIGSHEAVIRQAYKDSVGVWTWSVGLTSATGHDVTRYIDKPASLEKCMAVYVWALERYAAQVREAFAGHDLTKAQFAAALSFHWNTGAIKRASWVKRWKAGDTSGARKAFMNWLTPASIATRRRAERDLFFDGKWHNDGTMVEYTRLTPSHTPVWSSAKRIDVRQALNLAFVDPISTPQDLPSKPDAKPGTTTLTPSASPVAPPKETSPVEDKPTSPPKKALPVKTSIVAIAIAGLLVWAEPVLGTFRHLYDYLWRLIP